MNNVEVVEAFFAGFDKQDASKALAMMTEDCVVVEPDGMPHSGTYTGRAEISALWERMDRMFRHVTTNGTLHDAGDFVVGRQTGTFTSHTDSCSVTMPLTEFFWIRDSRIARIEAFYKSPTAMQIFQ